MKIMLIGMAFGLLSTMAQTAAKPNETERQSKASIQRELKSLADFLGPWKLECTQDGKVTLTAEAKSGKSVVKTTYGNAGETINESDTYVQQIQVADAITLLVSGPDYDEGSALVILPGGFTETVATNLPNRPIVKRSAEGTALIYGDVIGEAFDVGKLSCELK